MARRQLRKFQALQEQEAEAKKIEIESEDDDQSEEEVLVTAARNRFDLLLDVEESDNAFEEDQETTADKTEIASNNSTGAKPKKKKKKKKNKKNKEKAKAEKEQSEDEDRAFDRLLAQFSGDLEINSNAAPHRQSTSSFSGLRSQYLSIDYNYFDDKSELQRMFGADVVPLEDRNQRQRLMRHQRGRGDTRPSLTGGMRSTTRKHHGISMEKDPDKVLSDSSIKVFKFVHDTVYQKHQYNFEEALQIGDFQGLNYLVHTGPGNVDVLLQLSGLFRGSEDFSHADELIKHALLEMECYQDNNCNFSVIDCTLDYNRQENRSMFHALFYQMLSVVRRRCYRAALEYCKLLMRLSADGDDPLAALLNTDYYAIRCREFLWLREYYNFAKSSKCLDLMPNFAYSSALASFFLSEGDGNIEAHKSLKNILLDVKHKSSKNEFRNEADSKLQYALMAFPEMLPKLLECNKIKPDDDVLNCKLFYKNSKSRVKGPLNTLLEFYTLRMGPYWKEPAVLKWLQGNVSRVVEEYALSSEMADAYINRVQYNSVPIAIQRHLILSDVPEMLIHLPKESIEASQNNYFDVLPPRSSFRTYTVPKPVRVVQAASARNPRNILMHFLEAMVPDIPLRPEGEVPREGPMVNEHGENVIGTIDRSNLMQSVDWFLNSVVGMFDRGDRREGEGAGQREGERPPEGEEEGRPEEEGRRDDR